MRATRFIRSNRRNSTRMIRAAVAVTVTALLTGAVAVSGNASDSLPVAAAKASDSVEGASSPNTSAVMPSAQLLQTNRLKAISHNICGGCEPGSLDTPVDPTIAEIESWKPHLVMLQEVCYEQYEYVASKLAPEYNAVFIAMQHDKSKCERGTPGEDLRWGQVLLARGPMTGREEVDLDGDTHDARNRHFTGLCYDVTVGGFGTNEVKACVTHIRAFANITGQPWHARGRFVQHAKLAEAMDDDLYEEGQIVVLGGDFNAEPELSTMDPIYKLDHDGDPTGYGAFLEADQDDATFFTGSCTTNCRTGQPTSHSGRKIDYIFFASDRHDVSGLSGGVITSTTSDHNLYRGLADFTEYEPVTIADFEDAEDWESFWVRASGQASATNDGFSGTGLELTYDFTESLRTRGVGAWAEGRSLPVSGEPAFFTLQVNPEGLDERSRMQFRDGNNDILTVQSSYLNDPGWQQLVYRIPPGTEYPLTFERFYFNQTDQFDQYQSELVVDELVAWRAP